jgi:hypothetical protein
MVRADKQVQLLCRWLFRSCPTPLQKWHRRPWILPMKVKAFPAASSSKEKSGGSDKIFQEPTRNKAARKTVHVWKQTQADPTHTCRVAPW